MPEGQRYEATIYSDAADVAMNPNHLRKETRTVPRGEVLKLELASGGGAVVWLRKP